MRYVRLSTECPSFTLSFSICRVSCGEESSVSGEFSFRGSTLGWGREGRVNLLRLGPSSPSGVGTILRGCATCGGLNHLMVNEKYVIVTILFLPAHFYCRISLKKAKQTIWTNLNDLSLASTYHLVAQLLETKICTKFPRFESQLYFTHIRVFRNTPTHAQTYSCGE